MKLFVRSLFVFSFSIFGFCSAARAADQTLTWLGHAAFIYSIRTGQTILIDPWTTNPKAPKTINYGNVVGILVTHGHSDHVGEAFELAKKFNAPLIASYELTAIAEKHGVKSVLPLNASGSTKIGDLTITAVPAIHSSSYKEGDQLLYAGAPLGFVIQEFGGYTIYHAGDTGVFSDMSMIAELYHPQIALLPIGGVYTMKPAEAAKAVQLLQVRKVIPMHFGTFPALTGTPDQLANELQKLGLTDRVYSLAIGKPAKLSEISK